MVELLNRLSTVPRWIIFFLDLACVVLSGILAFVFRYNFEIQNINFLWVLNSVVVFSSIYTILFLLFRTYAGIIRFSGAKDTIRILQVTVVALAILLTMSLAYQNYYGSTSLRLPPNSVILIQFFICTGFLVVYRLMIKEVFDYYRRSQTIMRNVLVFGAGRTGLSVKRVIANDSSQLIKVIGFLDDDPVKQGKKLDGLPVFASGNEALDRLTEKHDIQQIIMASGSVSTERKNLLVDWSLAKGIKVLTIPPPSQWINGQLKGGQLRNLRIEDLLERDAIKIRNEKIQKQLKGKRVMVTGAAGSIGSEIVRQLLRFGPEMIILCDQAETPLNNVELEIQELEGSVQIKTYIADIKNKSRLEKIFEATQPHWVFHAAAYKHVPMMECNPVEAVLNNVMGTQNVADLSVQFDVERFIMVSTDKAVNPTNVMGATKRIAEIYIQSLNKFISEIYETDKTVTHSGKVEKKKITRFITTRFGNVLGSNGSVIPRFRAQLEKGGPLTVTHPEITRYFMTIPEACLLVLEAASMGKGEEIFVFDMGKSVKIADLAAKMIRLAGYMPNEDIKIEYTGLRPGEKLYEELLNTTENTLPTHHEKITIAQVREYQFEKILPEIQKLKNVADEQCADMDMVRQMKVIVPEFKSNNSVFSQLDRAKAKADVSK